MALPSRSRALLLSLVLAAPLGLAQACDPAPGDDAGTASDDAGGSAPVDAGEPPDASSVPDDAGGLADDAGTSDAGAPEQDAGAPDAGPSLCPADDAWEDNDERASAAALAPGEVIEAAGCGGDDDWYALDAEAGCSVEARLELDPSTGDLDLSLYGPSGQLLDVASGFSVVSIVQATASAAGSYAVRVRGPSSARTPYRLVLSRVCQTELSCPADDPLEENDDAASARPVEEGVQVSGVVCADDSDFYRVSSSPGCVLDVRLDFTDADGDLDLKLHRADGTVSSSSTSTEDGERVLDAVPDEGPQAIEVYGFSGAENTYRLRVDAVCPNEMGCPTDDPFEPNNAKADAFQLERSDEATGMICGENEDWYRFYAGAGCAVDLDLLFAHADGDLDVQLRDSGDQVVASGTSSSDNEEVGYTPGSAGTLWVRVYGFQMAQNRYRMKISQTCP